MISTTRFINYFDKNLQSAQKSIIAFKGKRDSRSLHQLRIAIKKLRAGTLLFEDHPLTSGSIPFLFEMLKPLNKVASQVREMDVISELLQHLGCTQLKPYKKIH